MKNKWVIKNSLAFLAIRKNNLKLIEIVLTSVRIAKIRIKQQQNLKGNVGIDMV